MDRETLTPEQIAAQCWTDPETSHIAMDVALAHAFARRFADLRARLDAAEQEREKLEAEKEELQLRRWIGRGDPTMSDTLTPTWAEIHRLEDEVKDVRAENTRLRGLLEPAFMAGHWSWPTQCEPSLDARFRRFCRDYGIEIAEAKRDG